MASVSQEKVHAYLRNIIIITLNTGNKCRLSITCGNDKKDSFYKAPKLYTGSVMESPM